MAFRHPVTLTAVIVAMTPAAFEATVARLVGRRLRELYELPDLTAL